MIRKGYKQSAEWVRKRVESRSGYKPSEESRIKMSKAKLGSNNPFYGHHWNERQRESIISSHLGKHQSEEAKKKISIARINYYNLHPEAKPVGKNNPMYDKKGKLNPMFGKHLSEEARFKLSTGRIGKYTGKFNPYFGMRHSVETKRKMREKWKFRSFAQRNNNLETKLQKSLTENKITFKTHFNIEGRPDIFIGPNICIFVDGCYWHGCECKFDPEQKGQHSKYIKSRMKHDIQVAKELKEKGFVVVRFWEHQLRDNASYCVETVKNTMLIR